MIEDGRKKMKNTLLAWLYSLQKLLSKHIFGGSKEGLMQLLLKKLLKSFHAAVNLLSWLE